MRWRLCELFVLFLLTWKSSGTSLTLNNKYLPGKVLRSIEHSSLFDCSASCDEDSKCLSFNFVAFTLVCELNSETGSDHELLDKKKSYFSNKKTTNTSPCSELTCIESHVCHVNRGHNPPTCVRRDADMEPDVTSNCYDVMRKNITDGVYTITAPGNSIYNLKVYCDMTTDCGGWLVFQRRTSGSVKFNRTWNEYMDGFGDVNGEFWLGNEKIHQITSGQSYELRVDMEDFYWGKYYAVYSTFSVDSKEQFYKLHIGQYSGNAGDSMSINNDKPFNTEDNYVDPQTTNCEVVLSAGWWFNPCHQSCFLNGNYTYLLWRTSGKYWHLLKTTEMKMRPILN